MHAHAIRAAAAAVAYRAAGRTAAGPVERAVRQAIALWNAGLFFEVHEVLEEVWKTAAGLERQALQGMIQIAVAFHHLAHGNVRGARSLLHEGRERLAAAGTHVLPVVDDAALQTAVAPWATALAGGGELPHAGQPPPLLERA